MLHRLIHSARVKVFESSRFYYWVLWCVVGYSILNQSIKKILWVMFDKQYSPNLTGIIVYSLTGAALIISFLTLLKAIRKDLIFYMGLLSFVVLIQSLMFTTTFDWEYFSDFFIYNNGFYLLKYLFPFLFLSIWMELNKSESYAFSFFFYLKKLLVLNACLIYVGAVFSLSLFESYPLSGRWGYSGILWSGGMNNIMYAICLIHHWSTLKKLDWEFFLLSSGLLLMGQKSALLYLLLIIVFVVNKMMFVKKVFFAIILLMIVYFNKIISFISSFDSFWSDVYEKHGAMGVFLSLRNENIEKVLSQDLANEHFIYKILFGGLAIFPERIEMYPVDMLFYFGAIGLIATIIFYVKWIPEFKYAIPIIVASFGGQLYDIIPIMMVFLVWVASCKRQNFS